MIQWQCGRFLLDLSEAKVMGIVNMTPDSFSDGGRYSNHLEHALAHARQLLDDGADILDIGGESSRPNAAYVSPEEEWQRVAPILRELRQWQVPVTLDTRRTEVMRHALEEDVCDAINDIAALCDEGAVDVLAQYPNIGICLMHMQGLPENMQDNPQYDDVADVVRDFLQQRVDACLQAGIDQNRLLLDPGIGFGKTVAHNMALLRNPDAWQTKEPLPYLIGVSKKSVLGALIGEQNPDKRVTASVAAAVEAVRLGAHIVRVHNVAETCQALLVHRAFQAA